MTKLLFVAVGCVLFLGEILQAQTKPRKTRQPEVQSSGPSHRDLLAGQKYFTDAELVNQDGAKMRFHTDILKGRTVAIITFSTTCTDLCPLMNQTMKRVQTELGERVGKDIYLISLTVDPLTDTPKRLKEYAATFNTEPGWYFLTGNLENVNLALKKLGRFVADKNEHSHFVIIANLATARWVEAYGLTPAWELANTIQGLADDKGEREGDARPTAQPIRE